MTVIPPTASQKNADAQDIPERVLTAEGTVCWLQVDPL
jgi:hypothetical protein